MRVSKSMRAPDLDELNQQALDQDRAEGLRLLECEATDKLAVLVNTPRMLRAANVYAEQAGLHGTQVRVFVDEVEAMAWLYKSVPRPNHS